MFQTPLYSLAEGFSRTRGPILKERYLNDWTVLYVWEIK